MADYYPNIVRQHNNINSKLLFNKIDKVVMDVLPATSFDWSLLRRREDFIDYVREHLAIHEDNGELDRISVTIESEPTKVSPNIKKHTLVLRYRQNECLNMTMLRYSFVR